MDRNAQAIAPKGVIEIGGNGYVVKQATLQDMATIRQHIQGMVQTPLRAIAVDVLLLPPHLQIEAVKAAATIQAQQGGRRRELSPEEFAELSMTPEGCRFVAFVLLRDENPGIKQDSFATAIHDENAADIMLQLMEASGLKKSPPSPGPPGSP